MARPNVICLTPVKNEALFLERFLKCASMWADYIIIADQASNDGSREIALSFPKVVLIDNPSTGFNEPERQNLLLEAARRIPGPRLLIALDVDEFLTANFATSPEWDTILRAPAGTVIWFQWPSILSDLSYFMYPNELPLGFVDDGREHSGKRIHSPRLPIPSQAPRLFPKQIKVMHYVVRDPSRWKSKACWYQCWELLNLPGRRPIDLYRFYHKDQCVPDWAIKSVPEDWLLGYERQGIDMTSVSREMIYRWDQEVLDLLCEHGVDKFKRLAIWGMNWSQLYKELYSKQPEMDLHDPRNWFDERIHRWLARTQPHFSYYGKPRYWWQLYYRFIRKGLKVFGW